MIKICCLLLFFIVLTSCGNANRDTIKFKDPFEVVQISVMRMDSLLYDNDFRCNAVYNVDFEEDTIKIMNSETDEKYKPGHFCKSSKEADIALKQLVLVLKRNGFNYVYSDYATRFHIFGYHNEGHYGRHHTLLRDVIINEEKNLQKAVADYRVLEKKGKLVLLSPR